MSLTPREIEEIEAVAKALLGGPVHSDYQSWCAHLASELRKLLPQPETLEEAVASFLDGYRFTSTKHLDGRDHDRLRAALARRRKEQGK